MNDVNMSLLKFTEVWIELIHSEPDVLQNLCLRPYKTVISVTEISHKH